MSLSGSDPALMQARADLARSDATRAGYFYPNTLVLIGGVDRASKVDLSTVVIEDVVADQPNRCTFEMRGGAFVKPSVGQSVIVAIGANQPELRLFAGTVFRVTQAQQRAGEPTARWAVDATDYHWLLDRRLVNADFTDVSATDAAQTIVADFTSGFSPRYIAGALPNVTVSFINARPSAALARIAEMVGATFYWDADRTIYLYTVAPVGQEPDALTSGNDRFWNLELATDLSQVRTRVVVEGKSTTCPVSTPDGVTTVVVDQVANVDYLIVGGGGGGSTFGGGGGGGVLTGTYPLSSGAVGIVVGAGGAAATVGSSSSFGGFSATGGGRGGSVVVAGGNGGCGGGDGAGTGAGSGTSGQGYNGGPGFAYLGGAGGGGGGAGGAGGAAYILYTSQAYGGAGGTGRASDISGSTAYYGGGGGGGGPFGGGSGGLGGGGGAGVAGTVNTGGGGGSSAGGGLSGGRGIVVLSYVTGALSATGGTITTVGGRTIHTFTDAGADTFTVSDVTYTAVPSPVTDLPLADASQLEAGGGTVRIGPHVVDYDATIGPTVVPGQNLEGSTITTDAAALATSLTVDDIAVFGGSYGWVRVGDQVVRYASQSGANLQGIPAIGFGSLQAPVSAGTQITWLTGLRISDAGVTFDPPIRVGETVVQRLAVDDTVAQTTLAALEGGDGVHEHLIQDSEMTAAGAQDRAVAELQAFALPVTAVTFETRDRFAQAGRFLTVSLAGLAAASGAYTIQQVTIDLSQSAARDVSDPRAFPVRRVTAAPVRTRSMIDIMAAREDAPV